MHQLKQPLKQFLINIIFQLFCKNLQIPPCVLQPGQVQMSSGLYIALMFVSLNCCDGATRIQCVAQYIFQNSKIATKSDGTHKKNVETK